MATEIFTSWKALYDAMLDSIAAGEPLVYEVRKGSFSCKFRRIDDIKKWLSFVKQKVDQEAALSGDSSAPAGRTVAMSGGSWM